MARDPYLQKQIEGCNMEGVSVGSFWFSPVDKVQHNMESWCSAWNCSGLVLCQNAEHKVLTGISVARKIFMKKIQQEAVTWWILIFQHMEMCTCNPVVHASPTSSSCHFISPCKPLLPFGMSLLFLSLAWVCAAWASMTAPACMASLLLWLCSLWSLCSASHVQCALTLRYPFYRVAIPFV